MVTPSESDQKPSAIWNSIINYQPSNVYPEPGILSPHNIFKDWMWEKPPSNDYLELWEYQNDSLGDFIALSSAGDDGQTRYGPHSTRTRTYATKKNELYSPSAHRNEFSDGAR